MVAKTITLPNIRKLFRPDPGYTICEGDLSGADAQVVAWEAGDDSLKAAFRAGQNIHIHNARTLFPTTCRNLSDEQIRSAPIYHDVKRAVHATNYGVHWSTLVQVLRWSKRQAEDFQIQWFEHHPGILSWHERTLTALLESRTITNRFGFRRFFFDRLDSESAATAVLKEALAWVPQSTVAIAINKGLLNVHNNLCPPVELLLQVHDSFVCQYPTSLERELMPKIHAECQILIPYDDPLTIPITFKTSKVSWGEAK
jgi:DNA polymerase I